MVKLSLVVGVLALVASADGACDFAALTKCNGDMTKAIGTAAGDQTKVCAAYKTAKTCVNAQTDCKDGKKEKQLTTKTYLLKAIETGLTGARCGSSTTSTSTTDCKVLGAQQVKGCERRACQGATKEDTKKCFDSVKTKCAAMDVTEPLKTVADAAKFTALKNEKCKKGESEVRAKLADMKGKTPAEAKALVATALGKEAKDITDVQAKKFLKEANDKAKKDAAKGDAATCATAAGSKTGDALKTSMQACLKAKRDAITDKSEKAKYIKGQKDTAKDEAASALKACIVALDQNDAQYKKKVTNCRTAEEAKFVKNGGDAKAYKKDMQEKAKKQLLDKMTLGDSDDATLEAELEALGVDKKKLKRMKKEALTDSTSDTFSACFDAADTSTDDKKTKAKTDCMAEAKAEFKKLGGDDTKYEKEVKKAAGKKAQSLMATCLEDIISGTSDADKKTIRANCKEMAKAEFEANGGAKSFNLAQREGKLASLVEAYSACMDGDGATDATCKAEAEKMFKETYSTEEFTALKAKAEKRYANYDKDVEYKVDKKKKTVLVRVQSEKVASSGSDKALTEADIDAISALTGGKPSTATLKAKRQYLDETDGISIEMDFECTADCDGASSAGGFDEAQFIVGSAQIAADKKYKMSVGGAEQTQKMAAAPTPSGRRLLTTAASADAEGESGEEEVVVTPAPTAAPPTAAHDHSGASNAPLSFAAAFVVASVSAAYVM